MSEFEYICDWKAGFVMNPTKKQRVGYLTSFHGLGLGATLPADLKVYTPYNMGASGKPDYSELQFTAATATAPTPAVSVVGVINYFEWKGGVGDPIRIVCYISSENATQLKSLQQLTLKDTTIQSMGWWLADYDNENAKWFEQAHPLDPKTVKGQLNAPGKSNIRLVVGQEAEKIAANIDINVFPLEFEVVPAANNKYTLHFATTSQKKVVKSWGLVVGTQATTAVGT
jgi:hypothetical protein